MRSRLWRLIVVLSPLLALLAAPPIAQAHGPVAPIAASYQAKPTQVPPSLDAKVIDGDQRLWLRVPSSDTVVVLDYRGAPYLRFSRTGIAVNQNSVMYYLNQTPIALTPPASLTPATPPSWQLVSGAHEYQWHDGRLHALAATALVPGTEYVGRWTIPVRLNGRLSALAGGLWHAENPPLVWFWPVVVLFTCVLAARRLRRPALDARLARMLSIAALAAIATGGAGHELHGRPAAGIGQLIVLTFTMAFVAYALRQVLLGRAGPLLHFVISFAALWVGAVLLPVLLHGFVLMAVPALVARVAAVLALGSGASLFLVALGMVDAPEEATEVPERPPAGLDDEHDPSHVAAG